jgi:hypothetical protein
MTDDRMALIELIEKGADGDLVRDLLAFAAERMMELEVEARTGAPAGQRSPDRLTHRNGYRGPGRRVRAGSSWRSRSCARVPTFPRSWSRDARPRRRSPP